MTAIDKALQAYSQSAMSLTCVRRLDGGKLTIKSHWKPWQVRAALLLLTILMMILMTIGKPWSNRSCLYCLLLDQQWPRDQQPPTHSPQAHCNGIVLLYSSYTWTIHVRIPYRISFTLPMALWEDEIAITCVYHRSSSLSFNNSEERSPSSSPRFTLPVKLI